METHIENVFRELITRGHRISVVTTRHPSGVAVEDRPGMRVRYLSEAPSRRYSQAWWRASRAALQDLLEEGQVDFVLSQSLSAAAVVRVAQCPPVYPFLNGLALSHLSSEWHEWSGLRGLFRYRGMKLPEMVYYTYVHERPFLRKAKAVLATYDQLVPEIEHRYERVFVSYNGVDCSRFAPDTEQRTRMRNALGIHENDIVLLLAGVMTRQKGMHLGIESFIRLAERFPALALIVIGSGHEEASLRALGARSPFGHRINFRGNLPHDEMPGYFNAADIFLHPSQKIEGLPNIIVEAMASGVTVLATDTGGTQTAILDRKTGILVSKGDLEELTLAVEELITDRSLAAEIARAGLVWARERFAWPTIIDRLLADIASVQAGLDT